MGAHWRHLVNTTEPSMCSGDVAFLSNYFEHMFLCVYTSMGKRTWLETEELLKITRRIPIRWR